MSQVMKGVRKVSARLKSIAEMPKWATCCPEHVSAFVAMKDRIFTMLAGSEYRSASKCAHCGREENNLVFALLEESGPTGGRLAIALAMYDLDEGMAVSA